MSEPHSITFRIPGLWNHIRDMRTEIRKLLADHDEALRSKAAMAVSELLENAIKYGAAVPGLPDVVVNVSLTDAELTLRVSNGIDNDEASRRLFRCLEVLASSDPTDAYVARLTALSVGQHDHTGLGILRIAAEGGFTVSATESENSITVTARRPFKTRG